MAEQPMSVGANLAVALQRNRELTIELYTMRNESPPDDSGCSRCPSTGVPLRVSRSFHRAVHPSLRPTLSHPAAGLRVRLFRARLCPSRPRLPCVQERAFDAAGTSARGPTKGLGGVRGAAGHGRSVQRSVEAHS